MNLNTHGIFLVSGYLKRASGVLRVKSREISATDALRMICTKQPPGSRERCSQTLVSISGHVNIQVKPRLLQLDIYHVIVNHLLL